MFVRVFVRADETVAIIRESEFNEELHVRLSDQDNITENGTATVGSTIGDMEPSEFATQIAASMSNVLRETLTELGVGRVEPGQVATGPGSSIANRGSAGAHRGIVQVVPAWEIQYRGLPEWERDLRSGQTDYDIQQFLQASVAKDHTTLREMAAKYDPRGAAEEPWQRANLAEGAAATGGNLVPTPMANLIVAKRSKMELIGPRAQQFITANESLQIPTENVVMTAGGVAEAGTVPETTEPTFGQVTLTKKKGGKAVRSSRELLDDNPFTLVSVLSNQASRALAVYNDAQDANDGDGSGTNFTDAIMNNSSVTVIDAAIGTVAYTDFTGLLYTLLAEYRTFAVWLMNNTDIQRAANLLDGNGRPIFFDSTAAMVGLEGGQGQAPSGTILGKPVLESPGITAGEIVIGDLQQYGSLQDGSVRVEASDQVAFLSDQIVWKFLQRRDGAVLQSDGFKKSGGITG